MQKTLANKLYDTETATLIHSRTVGAYGDPAGYEETLYRTPDGYFFLYTNGGEASPYTKEDIRRMSPATAKKFMAE